MKPKQLQLLAFVVSLACAALAGCQGGGSGARSAQRAKGPEILRPTEDPKLAPYRERFRRVETLLLRWDSLRNDGRPREAEGIAVSIRNEVDPAFADFERAATGELGVHAQYLAVSALGFSGNARATQLLVQQVGGRDGQLIGNALIALSVRADPNTPGDVLLARIVPESAVAIRRYAPLTLANVLDARREAGLPVQPRFEQQALAHLGPLAVDHDPVARLHIAKALGALRVPGTVAPLRVLAGDPLMRVRWAASASLERTGDPSGFPEVVRLLHDVTQESKHIIRDVLVTYAAKIQGRPLSQAEIDRLGTGARAWSQWFAQLQHARGLKTAKASPVPTRR